MKTVVKVEPELIKCSKANDFVGIKIRDGRIYVYVPSFFRKSNNPNEFQKDMTLFLKSIKIAKTEKKTRLYASKNLEDVNEFPAESFLWILRDYVENGVYYNRDKKYINESRGKIEWKKTLRTVPIISDSNIIYDKIVSVVNSPANDIISQIYLICVYQSQINIGWLYGYSVSVNVTQKRSINEMTAIVRNEIKNTFDDIKKKRFQHMLKILLNIEGNKAISKNYTYGIENYYYVYERMLNSLLTGTLTGNLTDYQPKGYWSLTGIGEAQSSKLYPDTVFETDNKIYIFDAKMYQYGFTKDLSDLPSTSSMQKQITYGDYISSRVSESKKIRNAFVLPFDSKSILCAEDNNIHRCNENISYIGYAYVNWREDGTVKEYDHIYTFMLDFNYLLRNYQKDENRSRKVLCDFIEELIHNSDEETLRNV